MPLISILICTCNRAQSLAETLENLKTVVVPQGWLAELIVVDNASTDNTAQVARNSQLPQMPVRYVHEARAGKGYAYNTGMAAAQGQVLLFTDDDVRPPRDWIELMCAPIVEGKADAVGGGIRLAPHLERPWMQEIHRLYLADTSALAAAPQTPEFLIGANMAFSREIAARLRFDTQLGPGALGFGDDVLFYHQIQAANYRIKMALDVVVEHHVQESRLSRASFLERARKEGRSQAYLDYHWEHKPVRRPRQHLRNSLFQLLKLRLKHGWQSSPKEGASAYEMQLIKDIAYFRQHIAARKEPRNYAKHGLVKLKHN